MIMVAYPHDPAGTRDECHIRDESHVILTNDNTYRVIVPELAPFFKADLSIVHAESGLELKEGKDYNLGYRVLSAKKIAQRDLYGCIVIINPVLKGEFIVGYRSIGGNFVGIRSNVLTYLANALNDPTKTPFEKVIDRPSYFTPVKHEQHYADFLNKDDVAAELDGLADAIDEAITNADNNAIGDLMSRVNAVDALLNQYRQDLHIVNYNNPHKTTAAQAKALPDSSASVDSFKAFNKTIVELAEYINNRGITEADVDRYLAKFGDQTFRDTIRLKNNSAVIRNEGGTTEINLSTGDITISAQDLVSFMADSDIHSENETIRLKAGANVLEIRSYGTKGRKMDYITYNGHELIHGDNVRDKLRAKGGVGMRVQTQDTETVKWEGTSRASDPLKARVAIAAATLTKRGGVRLSNSRTASGVDTAPTPYVLNLIRKDLVTRVPKVRVINDHPMSAAFSLDAGDIDLDRVDNTNDLEKPISTAQQDLLDTYSESGHKHDVSEMELARATETELGVVRHSVELDDADVDAAATPKTVGEYANKIVDLATNSQGKLPADVLDVRYWKPIADVTCSGLTITFPPDADLYLNRVNYAERSDLDVPGGTVDIGAAYPGAVVNETFYIYINVINDVVSYSVSKDKLQNTNSRLHISTVKCTATEIMDVSQDMHTDDHEYDNNENGILKVDGVTSVGMFRELEEHEADPTAHIGEGAVGDASTVGLDLIKNYDVVSQISDASHNGLDEWDFTAMWAADINSKVAITPNLILREGQETSNGVVLTFPWSSGNDRVFMRNVNMKFNDPSFVSDVEEDGVRKRKVGYRLNGYAGSNSASIENWEAILGSYKDMGGDVYDVVLECNHNTASHRSIALKVYRNGAYERTLTTVQPSSSGWPVASEFRYCFIIFEYHPISDGFKYTIDIQSDQVFMYSHLAQTIVEMEFRSDAFDCKCTTKYLKMGSDIWRNAVAENTNVSYVNGNIKKAIDSGIIGFAGQAIVNGTPTEYRSQIDCIGADEGRQDEKYITAKGVYQSMRDGNNLEIITGRSSHGMLLMPINCRYAVFHVGLAGCGELGEAADGIDGVKFTVRNLLTNAEITNNVLDLFTLDRYIYLDYKYRKESEGSLSNNPPHQALGSYMVVGLRDI